MKKTMAVVMLAVLALTVFCGQALAVSGDLTIKEAKAYADAAMTQYVGTIPAYTAVVVRSYDSFADIYVDGKVLYISASKLLKKDAPSKYTATLKKGVKVFQQAFADAAHYTLKSSCTVKVCKVAGDWALVQTTGTKGLYAFVQLDKLTDIKVNG